METLKKIDNLFLNRIEMQIKVSHPGMPTPTKESLKSEIAKEFKVNEEKIEIKYILSKKNRDYSIAKVFVNQSG